MNLSNANVLPSGRNLLLARLATRIVYLLAPSTYEPRHVPRCDLPSLPQKPVHHRGEGGSAEIAAGLNSFFLRSGRFASIYSGTVEPGSLLNLFRNHEITDHPKKC